MGQARPLPDEPEHGGGREAVCGCQQSIRVDTPESCERDGVIRSQQSRRRQQRGTACHLAAAERTRSPRPPHPPTTSSRYPETLPNAVFCIGFQQQPVCPAGSFRTGINRDPSRSTRMVYGARSSPRIPPRKRVARSYRQEMSQCRSLSIGKSGDVIDEITGYGNTVE